MTNFFARVLGVACALAMLTIAGSATEIPLGYISFDVTGANVAQFDVVNLTGGNSSAPGDPSFPVTTAVSLTNLSLTVHYAGGGTHVFDSSYFTLDGDGLSFDGDELSTLAGPPTGLFGATDATLTGLLDTQNLMLNDGTMVGVHSDFSAMLIDANGLLSDGDLAVISTTTVPEPETWTMLGTGLVGLMGLGRKRLAMWRGLRKTAAGAGCAALLLVVLPAEGRASVKLSALTSPSSASAGADVNVTGSGFPSGTVLPGNVLVSVATTCGGAPTTTAAVAVQKVIATTEKVEFAVPATLGGGTYFVSISGTDSNGVGFDSGATCSTLQVTAPLLRIDTTNAADWKISNGALNIDFNTVRPRIFGLYPAGTTDNLIDLTNTDSMGPKGFYMDNAGFGSVTPVPGFHNAGSYLDWWVTFPSSSANAYTYTEHFVVTPNDPGVHVYFVANHATSDIAGSIGQVQWVLRGDLNKFPNTYSVNADLSNPGPTAIRLPSGPEAFSTDPGRAVQDATVDLHGFTDIPAGFTRSFYTKYDYSSYEYLHRAHGVYGSKYGAWVVLPSNESLVGGPTKQNLIFTGNLDIMEAYSNHLDNQLSLATPAGTASQRLFGPFYFRFNQFAARFRLQRICIRTLL